MKSLGVIIMVILLSMTVCYKGGVGTDNALISKGFLDDNRYSIVCRGYSKENLVGVAMSESAKRAALLTAYFYAQQVFDDTVAPDKDGNVDKYELNDNSATVFYVISKKNLKSHFKN